MLRLSEVVAEGRPPIRPSAELRMTQQNAAANSSFRQFSTQLVLNGVIFRGVGRHTPAKLSLNPPRTTNENAASAEKSGSATSPPQIRRCARKTPSLRLKNRSPPVIRIR